MIDTPITKKFYKKLELYLELRRQNRRIKNSRRGQNIWAMEKAVLLWAVKGHWHLGSPLTPQYLKDRLEECGFNDEVTKDVRKVVQNLISRNFAYHPQEEKDVDVVQLTDEGFLMGEVIEEASSKREYIYLIIIIMVWVSVILGFFEILKRLVSI